MELNKVYLLIRESNFNKTAAHNDSYIMEASLSKTRIMSSFNKETVDAEDNINSSTYKSNVKFELNASEADLGYGKKHIISWSYSEIDLARYRYNLTTRLNVIEIELKESPLELLADVLQD